MNILTTKEKILAASETSYEAKKALTLLFPEVFINTKERFKLGTILFRRKYPNNIYCIINMKGEVVIINITNNSIWDKKLKRSALKDWDAINYDEFENLVGKERADDFYTKNIIIREQW